MPKFRIRTLSIGKQRALFCGRYPAFATSQQRNRILVCSGRVQPTVLSMTYQVRITYEIRKTPKVDIADPVLQRRNPQERIPHTYDGDRPCTFRPVVDWRSDQCLTLLVPWISMWLFFYEVWFVTGEWLGGGVGHSARKPIPNGMEPDNVIPE